MPVKEVEKDGDVFLTLDSSSASFKWDEKVDVSNLCELVGKPQSYIIGGFGLNSRQ